METPILVNARLDQALEDIAILKRELRYEKTQPAEHPEQEEATTGA
jgi:hypothetical protein